MPCIHNPSNLKCFISGWMLQIRICDLCMCVHMRQMRPWPCTASAPSPLLPLRPVFILLCLAVLLSLWWFWKGPVMSPSHPVNQPQASCHGYAWVGSNCFPHHTGGGRADIWFYVWSVCVCVCVGTVRDTQTDKSNDRLRVEEGKCNRVVYL